MNALILTPYLKEPICTITEPTRFDLVLCADTAYLAAEAEGITPDIVIGDFDHGKAEALTNVKNTVRVPCEKDDTDTMLCIKYAIEKGADQLTILGGIGGRLDHTFANLQTLAYIEAHGARGRLISEDNEAFLVRSDATVTRREGWYLSVFAYDSVCTGVTLKGTKYEVDGVSLTTAFPLGVSNEIMADKALISVQNGTLLVILSKKD